MPDYQIVKTVVEAGIAFFAIAGIIIIIWLIVGMVNRASDAQKRSSEVLSQALSVYGSISQDINTLATAVARLVGLDEARIAATNASTAAFEKLTSNVDNGTRASQDAKLAADSAKAAVDTLVEKAALAEAKLDEVMSYISSGVVHWPQVESLLNDVRARLDEIKTVPANSAPSTPVTADKPVPRAAAAADAIAVAVPEIVQIAQPVKETEANHADKKS